MIYDSLNSNSTLRGPRPFQQARKYIPTWPSHLKRSSKPSTLEEKTETKSESYFYPPPRKMVERRCSKTEFDVNDIPITAVSDDDDEDEESIEEEIELCLEDLSSSHREAELSKITAQVDDSTDSEDEQSFNGIDHDKANLPPVPQISAPGYHDDEEEICPPSIRNTQESKPRLPSIPQISAPGYDDDVPPIPQICAPGFDDEHDEDNDKQTKGPKESVYDTLFFTIRCGGCHKPLSGQAITTSANQWHTRCFQCQACKQPLEHIAFYEKDGLPYCALDYHELFSPRCDYCKTPIEEHSISALGKTYHPGHFFCRECGKPFDENSDFLEHNGHAYCERDYYKQFGKKCKGCEETITGEFLMALGAEWHKECFVCAECGAAFTSSTFLIKQGKPYCDSHYHPSPEKPQPQKRKQMPPLPDLFSQINLVNEKDEASKICHNCHEPIIGRCSSAFGKDYHPLHFQCSECHKLLSVRVTGKKKRYNCLYINT